MGANQATPYIYADCGHRRQYDQSISRPAQTTSGGRAGFGGYGYQGPYTYTRGPSGGPHRAWGRAPPRGRPPPSDPSQAQYNPFGRRSSPFGGPGDPTPPGGARAGAYARVAPDPFGRMRPSRRPGGAGPRSQAEDEFQGESGVWRFVVVMGLIIAVIGFGGGLTASADTGSDNHRETGSLLLQDREREEPK